jgi:Zn-dependent protease
MGRLTLNPIKHIDPVGLLMMLLIGFGWAKPVPVNLRNFKHPKWYMAITALAGPVSNIILAAVVMFLLGLFTTPLGVAFDEITGQMFFTSETGLMIYTLIINTIFLSIALALFNMLPIPPLDGSKVLFSLLPESAYSKLTRYERYGIILLLVVLNSQLLFGFNIFFSTIRPLSDSIFNSLMIFYEAAFRLVNMS